MTHKIPEGFTTWHGGENPVPGMMVKDIFCRSEELWDGKPTEPTPSEKLRWRHTGGGGDIIAYRI